MLDHNERMKYEMLCRRDIELPDKIKSKLKCRYVHNNNPYLRIAPLKEEEAFLEPRIVLYRQAMYADEMDVVKKLAQPRVRRLSSSQCVHV